MNGVNEPKVEDFMSHCEINFKNLDPHPLNLKTYLKKKTQSNYFSYFRNFLSKFLECALIKIYVPFFTKTFSNPLLQGAMNSENISSEAFLRTQSNQAPPEKV